MCDDVSMTNEYPDVDRLFDMLFGKNNATARKEWIMSHALDENGVYVKACEPVEFTSARHGACEPYDEIGVWGK